MDAVPGPLGYLGGRDTGVEPAGHLCHADASPWNILTGPADRLFMIDPRGMNGEVDYDAAVITLKAERFSVGPKWGSALAASLSVPTERVDAWVHVARAARV